MDKPLWEFIDNQGSFQAKLANQLNSLYFPICNSSPFMSCICPNLHGDIKTGNNSFLMEPVSRIDLSNSKISRNFWVYINPKKIWSATGVSKDLPTIKTDTFDLEAGMLWQKITRQNKNIGLKAKITSFVPSTGEPVEIMRVDITNISKKQVKFTPTAAIPIYARSADNLRDHRHVTSLLNRIQKHQFGVIVKPTLLFDESGHKPNSTNYFVLGIEENANAPAHLYPAQEEFTGDNSDLEAPGAVFNNRLPDKNYPIQGKEAMGALRFKTKILKPQAKYSYIILMGITSETKQINTILKSFNTIDKVQRSLEETQKYWQTISRQISVNTADKVFDNWFRWVSIQPVLRKIFGCSFLPDFDYGRGGRGWRDLWQDCLSLILTGPEEVRPLLVNNFRGVRIDGSNATIIGKNPGEFVADRNNISRVWMDHGIWPLITTHLYIHQSADTGILFEEIPYFRDCQLSRNMEKDLKWTPKYGLELKTKNKQVYTGSVLEHILVQNLVQFFNVGAHNHIRLEGADWNDGLDMASSFGESVAFSAMYAKNLRSLCEILAEIKEKEIPLLEEIAILLDTFNDNPIDYSSKQEKDIALKAYFAAVSGEIDGDKKMFAVNGLIADLTRKSEWIAKHIQKTEWLAEKIFNGYYNNDRKKTEGRINGLMQMTLTGQTFPLMSGIATKKQAALIFKNAKRYLQDKKTGGFHLNTDFKTEQLNFGRAFSFIYGDKENGAFFSHMSVMFAYALYSQGFAKEGFEVLDSIYQMARNSKTSRIYPCLPEYFNAQGQGMYSYLTGSASWFILTVLTQVFGVRGNYGDLLIEPKLCASQFTKKNTIEVNTTFAGKQLKVKFTNPHKKNFAKYRIITATLNSEVVSHPNSPAYLKIERNEFIRIANRQENLLEIILD